mmetsp:Transcript_143395/g.357256  ORF Transcript_143395/g.357256 Transcript_143395/m.357256 type:complete len:277 (+) Transcript_143395:100-930(+)
MSLKRPICPGCRQPLYGDLLVSSCNHVFHRKCLAAAPDGNCPQCGEVLQATSALDIYGVSFGEALDPGAARLAAKIVAGVEESAASGAEGSAAAEHVTRLRAAAALLKRKEELKRLRQQHAEQREAILAEKENNVRQQEKLDCAMRQARKTTQGLVEVETAIQQQEQGHKQYSNKIDLARQRDAAHEYWDQIKSDQEASALKYLMTMVSFAANPARILTEILRLKNHVRDQFSKHKKEATAASRRLADGRRKLAEFESEQDKRAGQTASKRQRIIV